MLGSIALIAAGCGGGGGGGTSSAFKGRASLTVTWPTRVRLIPAAANSLQVVLTSAGLPTVTKVVARPTGTNTSTVNINGLAYADYALSVKAFPTTNATGVAQGVGASSFTVVENQTATATVSLTSTVATLSLGSLTAAIDKGQTLPLSASAQDADGNIVLLTAGGGTEPLTWSFDNSAVGTLTPSGVTASLATTHSGSGNVSVSMRINDGGTLVSASQAVTIRPISDGTGTVTIQ